jgi:hypothetical protein
MKLIKNLNVKEDKNILILLLVTFIILWCILYAIPGLFASLFTTFLGNIILLLSIILISLKNVKYGLGIIIILVILFRISIFMKSSSAKLKEGFTWSEDTTNKFIQLESTINPNVIFDTKIIQNQASEDEVNYLLENGKWPWSQEVQDLYMNAVMNNKFIRTTPQDSILQAQTIYNQAAILELLSLETKEGHFLLNGVLLDVSNNQVDEQSDYAYNSGLIARNNSVIRCNTDDRNNSTLEQIVYGGVDSVTNTRIKTSTKIDYNDLENLVPSFKYVNMPCNPCSALNANPDYSCPFTIKTKNNQSGLVSPVWQYLWNINQDPLKSQPTTVSDDRSVNINKFPILSELQVELNNVFPPATSTTSSTSSTSPPPPPPTA